MVGTGVTDIGILEVYTVNTGKPVGNVKTIYNALSFTLKFSENPSK